MAEENPEYAKLFDDVLSEHPSESVQPAYVISAEEAHRAHDMVVGLLLEDYPEIKMGKTDVAVLSAIADVLCWLLGHPNQKFARFFSETEAKLLSLGIKLVRKEACPGKATEKEEVNPVDDEKVQAEVTEDGQCNCPDCQMKRRWDQKRPMSGSNLSPRFKAFVQALNPNIDVEDVMVFGDLEEIIGDFEAFAPEVFSVDARPGLMYPNQFKLREK